MNMALTSKAFPTPQALHENAIDIRILDTESLLVLDDAWDELAEHALEENAYYGRRYSNALLAHIEARPLKAITVWRGDKLIALLPFVNDRLHWAGLKTLNKAWTTDYTTTSIPLIHRQYVSEAVSGLIDAMGGPETGSDVWLLPDISLDGAVNSALKAEMQKRHIPTEIFDPFQRAVLARRGTFEDHMKEYVSKKRRKDLRRNRKRLDELGEVTWTAHNSEAELEDAVEAFLRIEASGWKGERGTALDCTKATRAFAMQAFGQSDEKGPVRADVLRLDGKAIAVNLTLLAGQTGFTIKCAYDEAYRGQSAGLLLEEEMIRGVLEGNWTNRLDSSAVSGHLISSFWNETIEIADVLIDARQSRNPARFKRLALLETGRRSLRAKAKALVNRFRG